ncbi:D-alanine-D-alanine ligase [Brevibacterium pityocampae]
MTPADTRPLVAVLFGGRSPEHSVSCVTAAGVLAAIDPAQYRALAIGITQDGTWRLVEDWQDMHFDAAAMPEVADDGTAVIPPIAATGAPLLHRDAGGAITELGAVDVYFPMLHGPFGEDGTIQGFFELSGTPYVGSGVYASAASMDKHFMKIVLRAAGLEVCPWERVTDREWQADPAAVTERVTGLGFPVFVKPARAGSSVGVSKVADAPGLAAAFAEAFAHDHKVIVEPMVTGREIECGVLGSIHREPARASELGEITVVGDHEFYDFEAKYLDGDAVVLSCPADLDSEVADRVRAASVRAFEAFDCTGLARVDTFVTSSGEVVINEINTLPGMTPSSMFPRMWEASGVDYPSVVAELIRTALEDVPAAAPGISA